MYNKNMQSHSYHSKVVNQLNQPTISQKPVSYHTMYNGIHRNGFQRVISAPVQPIHSVNIATKFR